MKSETTHTPGEWIASPRSSVVGSAVMAGAVLVAAVPSSIANAHLIAAAPKMYEACKGALENLRHVCMELGVEHCSRCKVAAAIAKAEGRR